MVEKDLRNSKYSESNKGCVWIVFEFQSPTENSEKPNLGNIRNNGECKGFIAGFDTRQIIAKSSANSSCIHKMTSFFFFFCKKIFFQKRHKTKKTNKLSRNLQAQINIFDSLKRNSSYSKFESFIMSNFNHFYFFFAII